MKNLKFFKSAVATMMATVTMGSVTTGASAKTSYREVLGVITDTKGKGSSVDIYDEDLVEDMERPVEVLMPAGVTVRRDDSLKFNYVTVILECNSDSMNPTEFTQIIDAASYLQKETGEDTFVYTDGNGTGNSYFTKNKATKNLTKRQLMRYIDNLHDEIEEKRAKIDTTKYSEWILPVVAKYTYTKGTSKNILYNDGLDYIYFYIPYEELSENTNMAELANIVYTRFQEKHDYVVTWNEILSTERQMEKDSKVKIKR